MTVFPQVSAVNRLARLICLDRPAQNFPVAFSTASLYHQTTVTTTSVFRFYFLAMKAVVSATVLALASAAYAWPSPRLWRFGKRQSLASLNDCKHASNSKQLYTGI